MNQNRKEELLTRWMDDALTEEELREFEPILKEHPELRREYEEYAKVREDLKAVIPAEVEPPYPDFFNSHLERHIEGLSRGEERASDGGKALWSRLWTWWMAPAAVAALVAAFIAGTQLTDVPAPLAAATAVYAPDEKVAASAESDEALDATVIVLTGLDDIPDENLIGWRSGTQADPSSVFVSILHTY